MSQELTIAVIGDLMLDKYLEGEVDRVSPEAPVPVVRLVRVSAAPGGAANVALGTAALGCETTCIGVVGNDAAGTELCQLLVESGVQHVSVVARDRPTTVKWRVYARGQQMLRVDSERCEPVAPGITAQLRAQVTSWFQQTEGRPRAIIVSDYAKGVVMQSLVGDLTAHCPVVVDPKGRDISTYPRAAVWKPNLTELATLCGDPPPRTPGEVTYVYARATRLLRDAAAAAVCVTLGAEGMAIVTEQGAEHLPADATEVFDVTGAGDTVAAVLGATLAEGVPLPDACARANRAAAIAVRHRGAYAVSRTELAQAMAVTARGAAV